MKAGASIIADADIVINGSIGNSKIISKNGNIIIEGDVNGINAAIVAQNGDVYCSSVFRASIKAGKNIHIREKCIEACLIAKGSIYVYENSGCIEGGDIEAGMEIVANAIGNSSGVNTYIKLIDYPERQSFRKAIGLENRIEDTLQEAQYIARQIKILRVIEEQMGNLNFEQIQQLEDKEKHLNELKRMASQLNIQRADMEGVVKSRRDDQRSLIVRGYVYPVVYIAIGDEIQTIKTVQKNIIVFFNQGIQIGEYEQSMQKKRFGSMPQ